MALFIPPLNCGVKFRPAYIKNTQKENRFNHRNVKKRFSLFASHIQSTIQSELVKLWSK